MGTADAVATLLPLYRSLSNHSKHPLSRKPLQTERKNHAKDKVLVGVTTVSMNPAPRPAGVGVRGGSLQSLRRREQSRNRSRTMATTDRALYSSQSIILTSRQRRSDQEVLCLSTLLAKPFEIPTARIIYRRPQYLLEISTIPEMTGELHYQDLCTNCHGMIS